MLKKYIFFLLAFTLIAGCQKPKFLDLNPGTLIETNNITTINKTACASLVDLVDIGNGAQYDVQLIEIVYATEYEGKVVETSGMLFFPKGVDTVRFVNYCHGTVVPIKLFGQDEGTPSLFNGQTKKFSEIRNVGLTWASAGYAVFMPDYVGYGRTKKLEHPYVYYPALVKSIRDGDKAVKSYFSSLNSYYDDNLFLAGYSQGGGASLFSHRFYNEAGNNEFNVVASFNLSGPYNFKRVIHSVFEQKDQANPVLPIYAWSIYSFNKFSDLKRPNDHFFAYPVFDQTSTFVVPSMVPSKVFNLFFIQQIINGKDKEMVKIIDDNSIMDDWLPQGKVFLYHGNQDDVVPYFNSEDCFENLTQLGADVNLTTYEGKTHHDVLAPYILEVRDLLDQLK